MAPVSIMPVWVMPPPEDPMVLESRLLLTSPEPMSAAAISKLLAVALIRPCATALLHQRLVRVDQLCCRLVHVEDAELGGDVRAGVVIFDVSTSYILTSTTTSPLPSIRP